MLLLACINFLFWNFFVKFLFCVSLWKYYLLNEKYSIWHACTGFNKKLIWYACLQASNAWFPLWYKVEILLTLLIIEFNKLIIRYTRIPNSIFFKRKGLAVCTFIPTTSLCIYQKWFKKIIQNNPNMCVYEYAFSLLGKKSIY